MFNKLFKGIQALIKGHMTVMKYAFEKRVTLEYPEKKREVSDNFRGKIIHVKDENGNLICKGCGICQKVCPCKDLIHIEKLKDENGKIISVLYETDIAQCIFCGNCVEYCPSKAIVFSKEYELATKDKNSLRKVEKS